jgi:WD40 repeat protein
MTAFSGKRRRRRRIMTAAGFLLLIFVLTVVTGLWRRAVIETRRAEAEAARAEATNLAALGRTVIEDDRSEALAYAITSLGRLDTPQGRRLALRAICAGPPAKVLPELSPAALMPELMTEDSAPINPTRGSPWGIDFSPDGRLLAVGYMRGLLQVFHRDGGPPITIQGFEPDQGRIWALSFSPDGTLLVGGAFHASGEVRIWEAESGQLLRVLKPPEPRELLTATGDPWSFAYGLVDLDQSSVLTVTYLYPPGSDKARQLTEPGQWVVRRWPLAGGPSQLVGQVPGAAALLATVDLKRGLLVVGLGDEHHLHRLDRLGQEPPLVIGRHEGDLGFSRAAFHPSTTEVAFCDGGSTLNVWSLDGDGTRPLRRMDAPFYQGTGFSPDGSWLVSGGGLWGLRGPACSEPLLVRREGGDVRESTFTPDGRWLATSSDRQKGHQLVLWPLDDRYPRVLKSADGAIEPSSIRFHPDGSRLYALVNETDGMSKLMSWPLSGGAGMQPTVLFRASYIWVGDVDAKGRFLVLSTTTGNWKVPLDGGVATEIKGVFPGSSWLELDPTGTYVVARHGRQTEVLAGIDLETGIVHDIDPPGDGRVMSYYFDSAGRLLVARGGVLSRCDPQTGETEILLEEGVPFAWPIGDGSRVYIGWEGTGVRTILDLDDGSRTALPEAHQPPSDFTCDATGSICVSGHADGEIRIGPPFEEQPHVILGAAGASAETWLSPDAEWVFSGGKDGTGVLWPVPDLTKRPLHTLPYDELIEKLEALTNLRAVADESSPTGYRVEPDFTAHRGWETVPTW